MSTGADLPIAVHGFRNAWALDGFIKLFWRDAPLLDLWPQVSVLVSLTVVVLVAARVLACRWEWAG